MVAVTRSSLEILGVLESRTKKRPGYTDKMANFRGTGHNNGNKAKHRTKQAKAARLHAPKINSRSQRLTNAAKGVSV